MAAFPHNGAGSGQFDLPFYDGGNYILATWIFLRLLGIVYGVAFASLAFQITALAGQHGLVPAARLLRNQKEQWGHRAYFYFPTLCWWRSDDVFLRWLCWSGCMGSLFLILDIAPLLMLVLLWIGYRSLVTAGGTFLAYQWDALLLETGFLAIFLAPWSLWPQWPPCGAPPAVPLFLTVWLLFRLMFSSGFVKWRSGDSTWRQLTALKFHYETQPLPTPLAWHAHQLPAGFHKLSVLLVFVIEMAAPFYFFAPAPLRYWAGTLTILLMAVIAATGNYCFFNLNTVVLCVLLFDDPFWCGLLDGVISLPPAESAGVYPGWPGWFLWLLAFVLVLLSLERLGAIWRLDIPWPAALEKFFRYLTPLRVVNAYGLFTVMSTERPEIVIEGSNDATEWLPYEFKWKPGDINRRPPWVAPHQPRLDWQMWFAALGDSRTQPWFQVLLARLLEGAPAVLALLKHNPFPNSPPRHIRAVLYDYRFTDRATRRRTGAWWRRRPIQLYSPVLSADDLKRSSSSPGWRYSNL